MTTTGKRTILQRLSVAAGIVGAMALVVATVLTGCSTHGPTPTKNAPEPPYGIATRVVWTTSKVQGSPDAPDPFMMEPVFPRLKFKSPLEIAFEPGGNRVVVVEHQDRVYSFPNVATVSNADLLLDVTKLPTLAEIHGYDGLETLGFAFDPQYQKNHYCYICYHVNFPYKPALEYEAAYPQNATASHVSRFTISQTDPPTIDPASEQIILRWQGNGHNGGCLRFGPDGDLYISTGDNGDPNPPDPHKIGQNVGDLRAKILRIDVRKANGQTPYSIPADNPFVNTPGARGEVYAYGLRNPWRFSFDRVTGDCWAGDVGWELWESVQHIVSGGNYGWSIMEGPQPVWPNDKRGPTPIIPPAIPLSHTEAASLTGGNVYHGKRLPALENQYLFGDWETRRLWAAPVEGAKLGKHRTIAQTELRIVSFGEDADGEIYVVDYEGGRIWRIVPNPKVGSERGFPRKLSETGLFADVSQQIPNPGVIEFYIKAPQWLDGSTSRRFIAVPSVEPVTEDKDGKTNYPAGTVLVRTLSLLTSIGDPPPPGPNVETQLLHFDGRQWHAYTYQWGTDQQDASLVDGNGADMPVSLSDPAAIAGTRQQVWHFNSRAQCMTCHTTWTHYTLAFNPPQLDLQRHFWDSSIDDNQLRSFKHIGLIAPPRPPEIPKDGSPPPKPPPPVVLVDPYNENGGHSLEERARSYLAVNCSVCHRFGGGGTALIDLSPEKDLKETHLFTPPMLGGFNLPDARVVCPGNPGRSVLLYRMSKSGAGRMPHLGAIATDENGLSLLSRWIASLPAAGAGDSASETTVKDESAQDNALLRLQKNASVDKAIAAIDSLLSSTEGAMKLVVAMQDGRVPPKYRWSIVNRGMASGQETIRDLFARFAGAPTNAVAKIGANPDVDKLLAMPGDAERGRKVFFEQSGGLCSRCHIISDKGMDFGPNLSQIGTKYNRADMLDNILHPSKTIAQGYETYVVRTKSKESYIGFLVSKSDKEIVLKDQERKLVHVQSADIDKMAVQPISAMPEGMISDLEPQQAADLLEFLVTRK